MVIGEAQIEGHARAMRISLRGKGEEARAGAAVVIHGLLRFAQGLREEDQAGQAMLSILHHLAADLSESSPR